MKLLRALKVFLGDIWDIIKPTVSRRDVPVDLVCEDKLLEDAHGIMINAAATILTLENKLDAAAAALRRIERILTDCQGTTAKQLHVIASDARKATQA